jgi:hypothetical protein
VISWVEQILGVLVTVTIVLDVFLTVLYARLGSGLFSYWLAHIIWRCFTRVSDLFRPGRRGGLLALCGPSILVATVLFWSLSLAVGAGLLFHPSLGIHIVSNDGSSTPRDFVTALYAGGGSLSIVGAGELRPTNAFFRLVFVINSVIGVSVLSLTIAYLMQVYSALNRRNTVGLLVSLMARETADAAEIISSIGPKGKFDTGYTTLSEMAVRIVETTEGHHFYPVLFYFRFHAPKYSVSQIALLSLDTVALIRSALEPDEFEWLMKSSAVNILNDGTLTLIRSLTNTFLSETEAKPEVEDQDYQLWRERFFNAVSRLKRSGIPTNSDEEAAVNRYILIRKEWNHLITSLAPVMRYELQEIDPATAGSPGA